MRRPSHAFAPRIAGFTLLEMMITMAIFLLLAAAVFGILTSVLQSAGILQDNQNRRDSIAALNAFLKKQLSQMSAQSLLNSYRRGDGEGLSQNGIIFGEDDRVVAIDAKVQANGFYTLRLAHYGPSLTSTDGSHLPFLILNNAVTRDDSSLKWIPLIHDVRTIGWKFQDFNTNQWFDLWNNANAKPNLVEFSMQIAGDLQPVTMDFWIPRVDPISIVITPQAATPQPAPPSTPHVP